MRKPTTAVAAAAALALALAGCTGDDGGGADNLFDQIRERGEIKIGVLADAPPFSAENPQSREFEGFEIALAQALVNEAFDGEVEINFEGVTKATRVPMVQSGELDTLLATLSITDDRKEVVDFSTPYYASPNAIMVTEDSPIREVADIEGLNVCVPQGSAAWDGFRGVLETIEEYAHIPATLQLVELPSPADCLLALRQDRDVDFVVNDHATLSGQIAEVDGVRILDETLGAELNVFGIAFAKGDDSLRNAFEDALCTLFGNGTWTELHKTWLLSDPIDGWPPSC